MHHPIVLAHVELPRHGHRLAQLLYLLADVGGDDVGVEGVPFRLLEDQDLGSISRFKCLT